MVAALLNSLRLPWMKDVARVAVATGKNATVQGGVKCLIFQWFLVGREGLEPSTNGLRVRCSTN